MDIPQERVNKIQHFAEKRQQAEERQAQQPLSAANIKLYNARLDETLKELQERVKRQEDELRKLREINSIDLSNIGNSTWARVSQVRRAKKAYDSLLKSDTEFPPVGSPLPSLLAVEETARLVRETKVAASITGKNLSSTRQRVKEEETSLRDAQAIRDGLQRRIQTVASQNATREKKANSQLARELVEQRRHKNSEYDKATEETKTKLYDFVDRSLASMLAAESLGGPTVGDVPNVSDATLELGYTSHGKPKKPRVQTETNDSDSNQRRIDEILPRQNEQGRPANRREAAALEMRNLLDALLEASPSYVEVRESAASRFLVRAKVAQFHPRDARRLRLIDFGRTL
ncbi:uncharacterized protein BP01DRAFT_293539 [Aspergillus saccharolyticus JOP 1030-1]|uniref:Uncharacterized protein n=1 Tax=Aspergillus saccharolyticus JOP 1030-1 TaxID=1450539 RepID=A0A318ZRG6_9EURO|nr:hypothetical protein BP01DRAFT_293539 [Aspergillus saccharolyticus JOP 1030-1]PYH46550.1 hypothetical protein BP01DRAFT_293539 [Aspergillus saccharolyticus JOP 1030-1]